MSKEKVIYQGKIYIVVHDYGNGYCEIKEEGDVYKQIELVSKDELKYIR